MKSTAKKNEGSDRKYAKWMRNKMYKNVKRHQN